MRPPCIGTPTRDRDADLVVSKGTIIAAFVCPECGRIRWYIDPYFGDAALFRSGLRCHGMEGTD